MSMKKLTKSRVKYWCFYAALIVLPLLQFAVFYVYVNINSIVLAFQKYEISTGGDIASGYVFGGLENFKRVFGELFGAFGYNQNARLVYSLKNSLWMTFALFFISTPLTLLFSYVISKKVPASEFFKFFLFLPSIIPAVVLSLIYLYFNESAFPELLGKLTGHPVDGLMWSDRTWALMIILYAVITGFGPQTLIYVGSMNSINVSQIEAGKIDGVNRVQEFFHIVFPNIFPTFITFTLVSLTGIFINQFSMFAFYSYDADPSMYTFGYFIYAGVSRTTPSNYPYYAALGVLSTLIVIPVTLGVNKLMTKFGPRTE